MQLRPNPHLRSSAKKLILSVCSGLPSIDGAPVVVSTLPQLTAHRGKLLSSQPGRGTPVHAASFIRKREIVLETALFDDQSLLRLILVHEIFHFAWSRLGHPKRAGYAALLACERTLGARGELGESAAVYKPAATPRSRYWKNYVCESFCDTAAYLYAGIKAHPAFTLPPRWRRLREHWFKLNF